MDLDKAALDRYITGNYGEDQFRHLEEEDEEPEDATVPVTVIFHVPSEELETFLRSLHHDLFYINPRTGRAHPWIPGATANLAVDIEVVSTSTEDRIHPKSPDGWA